MPRKGGARVRLAPSIYQDRYGITGRVKLRGYVEDRRFPLGTSLGFIKHDLETRRDKLNGVLPAKAGAGTLQAAVDAHLAELPKGVHKADRTQLYQAWTTPLGPELFGLLSGAQLRAVVESWQARGDSPARIAKRISALRVLWTRVAPDDALPHPIERLKRPRQPKPQRDRALDLALLERIIQATAGPKMQARLRVLVWTGQPLSLLEQVKKRDVRWTATPPQLYVQPRRKGAGVDAAWIPLVPQAVDALKALFRLKADGGSWHKGNVRRAWKNSTRIVGKQLQKARKHEDAARVLNSRPYDARHSFLTALAQASGDIYAVAEAARHADLRTTRGYMLGASSTRLNVAIEALQSRLGSIRGFHPEPRKSAQRGQSARKSDRTGTDSKGQTRTFTKS